jgi:hypothetical protein
MDMIKDMWMKWKPVLSHYKIWMIISGILFAMLLFS